MLIKVHIFWECQKIWKYIRSLLVLTLLLFFTTFSENVKVSALVSDSWWFWYIFSKVIRGFRKESLSHIYWLLRTFAKPLCSTALLLPPTFVSFMNLVPLTTSPTGFIPNRCLFGVRFGFIWNDKNSDRRKGLLKL